jgi:DNA-binding NarL/FixJ family response regulator
METSAIKVMVVDDDQLIGAAMVRLLEDLPGVQVVAMAVEAPQAVMLERVLRPAVVLVDLDMEGAGAIETIRWMSRLPNAPAVIAWCTPGSEVASRAAEAAGASAVLTEEDDVGGLEATIRALAAQRRPGFAPVGYRASRS